MSRVVRNPAFAYAKTKTQISCAVTAQLISAFVFATWIVQSLFYLNPKLQASSYLLWLYSPVCVRPGRKPRRPVFSQRGSIILILALSCFTDPPIDTRFLAHLSRRLRGELIVYQSSRRPCVCASVNIFKH